MPFADDNGVVSADRNPHFGDVDGDKAAAALARQHTAGIDRFAAPAVEAEDPVRLRDRKPALDIGELAAMSLAGANVPAIEVAPQRLDLFCGKAHHLILTLS